MSQSQSQAFTSTLYGFKFREPDKRRVRKNEDGTRHFDIKQLWQRSHEILNLALLGHSNVKIAEMTGVTPATVSNTINSSLGMEVLSDKRKTRDEEYEKLQDEVMELTRESVEVYHKILRNPSENMKLRKETADTVMLELSGMKVPTRVDSRHVSMALTPEELAAFKQRGADAARAAGKLVEIDE